jgi:hypothetical protein
MPGTPSGRVRALPSDFPCNGQSTSSDLEISRQSRKHLRRAGRRFLTQRPQTIQLRAVMLRGASWSRNSIGASRSGSGPSPSRRIRSPDVGCSISPSGTIRRAARSPDLEEPNGPCRRRARRHRSRPSPDQARPDRRQAHLAGSSSGHVVFGKLRLQPKAVQAPLCRNLAPRSG